MELVFHSAQHKDLLSIAKCHKNIFPASLTSKMGTHYLSKIFSWYLSTDKAFLFFLEFQNQVIGYTGGILVDGTLPHGSASSMTQHTFNDAIKALLLRPWLFFHPDFLSRYKLFTRNILTRLKNKLRKVEIRSAKIPLVPHIGLVVIGVHRDFHRKGYGSALLKEFENFTIKKGFNKMMLTVKSDNEQAIKSYLRNGWVISKVEGKSTSMEKHLK